MLCSLSGAKPQPLSENVIHIVTGHCSTSMRNTEADTSGSYALSANTAQAKVKQNQSSAHSHIMDGCI